MPEPIIFDGTAGTVAVVCLLTAVFLAGFLSCWAILGVRDLRARRRAWQDRDWAAPGLPLRPELAAKWERVMGGPSYGTGTLPEVALSGGVFRHTGALSGQVIPPGARHARDEDPGEVTVRFAVHAGPAPAAGDLPGVVTGSYTTAPYEFPRPGPRQDEVLLPLPGCPEHAPGRWESSCPDCQADRAASPIWLAAPPVGEFTEAERKWDQQP